MTLFQHDTNIMNTTKRKILYITGAGRSGSTLLEYLLGQNSGWINVGEVCSIWARFNSGELCGCGKPLAKCEFWGEVMQQTFGKAEVPDYFRLLGLAWSVSANRYIIQIHFPQYFRGFQKRLREYGEILTSLYDAIQKISGANIIVDSSKYPPYGLVLSRSLMDFDIYFLHLIRDSRGVAYSWQRKKARPDAPSQPFMPQKSIFQSSREYLLSNSFAQFLQMTSSHYLRIKYENFVKYPDFLLEEIYSFSGYPEDKAAGAVYENMKTNSRHTIAGNPVKFQLHKSTIKLDSEWQVSMPWHDKFLVSTLTLPLLLLYQYPLIWRRIYSGTEPF